jgi:hypothetical protein
MFDRHQEKKPMTEEEIRPENTPPGALQPDEKPESQKSLTDKNSDLLTGTVRFQQTQEQKNMTDVVKKTKSPPTPNNPEDAKKEFDRIKEALIGPTPEWCLPRVNDKAKASDPKLDELIIKSCQNKYPVGDVGTT